jgi:ribosome-associated protein
MLKITPQIAINENEIKEEFVRSGGPGGQNVNKVSTAVQLRFDAANSPSLPEDVRRRLMEQARGYLTMEGILIIDAQRFRTQAANRQDALNRLTELIRKAEQKPRTRFKTRPTLASKIKRLETKRRRSETKSLRRAKPELGEEGQG